MNADSPTEPGTTPPQTGHRGPRWIGIAIGLVGLGFAGYAVYAARDEIVSADLQAVPLLIAFVVGLGGMTIIGLNWGRILRALGAVARVIPSMRWYFVGQLGKYIPGGLWAVLGRGELATRGGVRRPVAYPSVVMSLVTTYAAAAATGAIFLAFSGRTPLARIGWVAGSVAIIALTVFGLSETVVARVSGLARRLGMRRDLPSAPPRLSMTAIVLTMPAWVCIGIATSLCGRALAIPVDVTEVIAATSYSWLAGFLVLPLPGGLGVREAVFIALFDGTTAEAAAIAVVARLVFVAVDVSGSAVASLVERLTRGRDVISGSR